MSFSIREWTTSSSRTVQSSSGEAGACGGHGIVICHQSGLLAGAQLGLECQGSWVREVCGQAHLDLSSIKLWEVSVPVTGEDITCWWKAVSQWLSWTPPNCRQGGSLYSPSSVCSPDHFWGSQAPTNSLTRASPLVLLSEKRAIGKAPPLT